MHALALDGAGAPVGTARMQVDGHIGRMAVLTPWRRQGVGRALLAYLIQLAARQGLGLVWLTAQIGAVGFYTRAGFVVEGEPFTEAGILHRTLTRRLAGD